MYILSKKLSTKENAVLSSAADWKGYVEIGYRTRLCGAMLLYCIKQSNALKVTAWITPDLAEGFWTYVVTLLAGSRFLALCFSLL